jgi:hypothetical protein
MPLSLSSEQLAAAVRPRVSGMMVRNRVVVLMVFTEIRVQLLRGANPCVDEAQN